MQLKSITTQGFKSFAKKINIDLESQVTGVVGPNGSGKSNVVEAIKFVLGEQSMKGLRSKTGSDLIFKGSHHIAPLSRASVSIHLDNRDKSLADDLASENSPEASLLKNFLNLDEIVLTREIYKDGASEYFINDTKVRLKDVQELLAMANISVAGHTIVNQGEADRILLSNNVERREMIEDALGLRIYHLRIKEGEKKLEKVEEHLKEIEIQRRENLPHLKYLKKQVSELERREDEIEKLSHMLKVYLYKEDLEIKNLSHELEKNNFLSEIQTLEQKLLSLESQKENPKEIEENRELTTLREEANRLREEATPLTNKKDTLYREKVNLELEIKFILERLNQKSVETLTKASEIYTLNKSDLEKYQEKREIVWEVILETEQNKNYAELPKILREAKLEEIDFLNQIKHLEKENNAPAEVEADNSDAQIEELKEKLSDTEKSLELLDANIASLLNKRKEVEEKLSTLESEEKEKFYKLDNQILEIKLALEKLHFQEEQIQTKKQNLHNKETNFENILQEYSLTLGTKTFRYKNFDPNAETAEELQQFINLSQGELFRKIERSKIIIEESGVVNASEILSEYETLSERDNFLINEIEDLEKSRKNLETLITDLKNTLLERFNTGLETINRNFNNFFTEIFPGGSATLSLVKEKVTEAEDGEEEEQNKKAGIKIAINLPQKKIHDLQMLSGGERALSSIALIFALSSINHPPFMILDETDAALDEANAQKYGRMIRRLAENSKLLVVTHNRETMNQCDVLYGVTVGAEGASKLLSIKFDQATEFAK